MAVAMVTVVLGSFVNAEMSLQGWKTSQISIFLGIGVYFEVIRIYFGRLSDRKNKVKPYIIFGLLISSVGLIAIPFTITPAGNLSIIFFVILLSVGTAVISTLIDSHVTAISTPKERNKVAGTIQGLRLAGFALGGILGFLLYSRFVFVEFVAIILGLYLLMSIISLFNISDAERIIISNRRSINLLAMDYQFLKQSTTIMMIVFLLLYPLGLFMQDNVLEPYAINVLGFDKSGVGRLSAIWGIVTLLFVPLGIRLSNRFGRILISVIGQFLAATGLIMMAISGILGIYSYLYAGLVLFGSGAGLYSVPGIASMFDVAAKSPDFLATNLAIFGILVTLSRGNAGILSGFILTATNENYYVVFFIEALISLISILPYVFLERRLTKT